MSAYQNYKDRLQAYGGSLVDSKYNHQLQLLAKTFKDDPSYEEVTINNGSESVGIRIVDDTKVTTKKKVYMYPGQSIHNGDFIKRSDGSYWLCLGTNQKETSVGYIEYCNTTLQWVDSDGIVRSYPCVFYFNTRSNFGEYPDKIMAMPDGRRQIAVQLNQHTKKLNRSNRFLFDGQPFKVIDYDYTSDQGLVNLSLKEDTINESDNVELNIANYYGRTANFTLTILNGEHFSIRAGKTIQFVAEVKNNGQVVNKNVTWSVSDESVATIDKNGLFMSKANGQVIVTATMVDNPTITDTTTVTVELDNTSNYSVDIVDSSVVVSGTTKTFTGVVNNNNSVDNTKFVQFYLYAEDGISPPSIAKLVMNSSTQCQIKGIGAGTVILKVVMVGKSSVYKNIPIEIKSLI